MLGDCQQYSIESNHLTVSHAHTHQSHSALSSGGRWREALAALDTASTARVHILRLCSLKITCPYTLQPLASPTRLASKLSFSLLSLMAQEYERVET